MRKQRPSLLDLLVRAAVKVKHLPPALAVAILVLLFAGFAIEFLLPIG